MNTQEYLPVTNCMALTIKKEHRLTVVKKAAQTFIRISWKTLLYAFILTVVNVII